MNAPFFVAETSRAGAFGHRFILPPGRGEESSLAARFCQYAAKYGAGQNFIGVTQPVRQQLPNGAVRQGVETLVLVGVDYARLHDAQKQQIKAVLSRRLADLETLVTRRIDWEREGESLVVTRQELDQWLHEDRLLHFSSASVSTGPLTKRWISRISPGIVVACVLALSVGASIKLIASRHQPSPSGQPPRQEVASKTQPSEKGSPPLSHQSPPDGQPPQPALAPERLSSEKDCDPLIEEINKVNDKAGENKVGKDYIKQELDKAVVQPAESSSRWGSKRKEALPGNKICVVFNEQKTVDPYVFLSTQESVDKLKEFKEFFIDTQQRTVQEAYDARHKLVSIGKSLHELHKSLGDFDMGKLPKKLPSIFEWLDESGLLNPEHEIKKIQEREIVLPFFDRYDITIVSLLHSLFSEPDSPIHQIFPKRSYKKLYVWSLDSILAGFCAYQTEIVSEINKMKGEAKRIDELADKDKKNLQRVYAALQQVLGCSEPG